MSDLSWLNPTPHAIAVYASRPLSPVAAQHSLPSGRYPLLGPDFHRLDRTSLRLAHSLDHLVGAAREGQRHGDAERLGGLEVEDQLDFRGLHDREVSRLLAFENAAGVETGQTVRLRNAASVAHQTAGGRELAPKIDCWNAVAEGECAELRGVAAEQRILPITSAATRN